MTHQKNSIGRRFSRVIISVVLIIFSVFSIVIITYNINRIDRNLDQRLGNILKLSEITMAAAVWQLHYDYLRECASSIFSEDIIVYVGILDDMNNPLVSNVRDRFQQKPFSFFQKSQRFKARESDIVYKGEKIGIVQIAISRESFYKELILNTSGAIVGIVLLIIAIVIATLVTTRHHIIHPLLKLKDSAGLIAGGDLDAFIDKSHDDEIGSLANDLDSMRQSIKHLFIAGTVFKRVVSGDVHSDPARILKMLNIGVKRSLYEKETESALDDGMDAGICFVNTQKNMLTFAGARIPLICIRQGKLEMIKGDRQSIGYKKVNADYEFTNHQVPADPGTLFYLSSDGYTGQPGGPKNLSIGRKRWHSLLQEICSEPFDDQKERLTEYLNEWKGEQSLKDDIGVVGFGFRQK